MRFTQVMRFETKREDEIRAMSEQWMEETSSKRARTFTQTGRDRAHPDRYYVIVQFESYDEAMRNSALPETRRLAEQLEKLCDGPVEYVDLDIVWEDEDLETVGR